MKKLAVVLLSLTAFAALADDVNIKALDLKNQGSENRLSIKLVGNLNDNPQINVKDKTLTVTIPNAHVASKIQRTINGAVISATQLDRETVTVKTTLPYSLQGKEANVNITLKDGSIDVSFPRIATAAPAVTASKNFRVPAVTAESMAAAQASNAEADKLDENYLSNLEKQHEKLAEANHAEEKTEAKKAVQADTDRVNVTQAAVAKSEDKLSTSSAGEGKSNFSLSSYIGKFVAFLSLMILGFYGVLTLFKKGVIKKGKLGFLHSTKMVEVLSTTHVAPKRTLMMVKAHKQVFLVSNTEAGMTLISEINDVTGLIKTGEEEVTGSNFDTNLYTANKRPKEFKLKEDTVADNYSLDDMLNEDTDGVGVDKFDAPTSALKSIEKAPVKDQVRFSDQIKSKIKNMKQIQ